MKAVSLRLRISDKFDGEPVAKFTPASEWQVEHPLNRNQRDTQQITKHIWDTQTRRDLEEARKRPGYRGPLSQKETFPAIMAARLSPVHEACPFAGYGEAGDMDLVDGPGGLQEDTLENMLLRIEDGDGLSRGYQGKNIKKSKERRSEFRGKMKTEWQSFRMTKMLEVISRQKQKGKRGKYLIFSDFLCVLDVAHAALDACGYKALRFDGWATTTEKETALQLFQDPTDGHEFLLVTNRSGGEGINLQEATTVIHLTPSWNPAMTRQCNSRAVRSGQKRNVDVFYFCIMDSIEGYIYRLAQEKDTKASELLDPTDQTLEVVSQSLEWDRKYFTNIVS
jgi:SNF2 family DNA or RNA helicase